MENSNPLSIKDIIVGMFGPNLCNLRKNTTETKNEEKEKEKEEEKSKEENKIAQVVLGQFDGSNPSESILKGLKYYNEYAELHNVPKIKTELSAYYDLDKKEYRNKCTIILESKNLLNKTNNDNN